MGFPVKRLRQLSDEQLAAAFRQGKTRAVDVLCDRYRPALLEHLRSRYDLAQENAEDAVQEVLSQLPRLLAGFEGQAMRPAIRQQR